MFLKDGLSRRRRATCRLLFLAEISRLQPFMTYPLKILARKGRSEVLL